MDLRGEPDLFGRALKVTEIGFADEIAAAASLVHGPGAPRAQPAVLVRGLVLDRGATTGAGELLRPRRGGSVPMSGFRPMCIVALARRRRRGAQAGALGAAPRADA